ncbi:membrane protein insertion efficiency factor YidD [Candidatus Peregrinibacteria bacterium HGW-Peregrinibacteria-1]|nr:MAG: membrane protein insertion efficiency factor YidD [Candidatus Peregrinibacteria bacterium HGW-Peregrinibacteria-1]
MLQNICVTLLKVPRHFFALLIKIYQRTLSPDHGIFRALWPNGYCRFHPSCSEYGRQAILKYGVFKGGFMASKRVIRCNPWNKGGEDPLP